MSASTVRTAERRFPLSHNAVEREPVSRLPLPQSALERVSRRRPPLLIPLLSPQLTVRNVERCLLAFLTLLRYESQNSLGRGISSTGIASLCFASSPSARSRGRGRAGGRPAVAAGRSRRRHDRAGEAPLEARSRCDRPARRAAAARLGGRVGDERQDDDG